MLSQLLLIYPQRRKALPTQNFYMNSLLFQSVRESRRYQCFFLLGFLQPKCLTFIMLFIIDVNRVRSTASDFSCTDNPRSICLLLTAEAITLLSFVYQSRSINQISFFGNRAKAKFLTPDTYWVHVSLISNFSFFSFAVVAVSVTYRANIWKSSTEQTSCSDMSVNSGCSRNLCMLLN